MIGDECLIVLPAGPRLFLSARQARCGHLTLLVRSHVPLEPLRNRVEAGLLEVDPRISLFRAETLQAKMDRRLQPQRLATTLLGFLATVAVLLALAGVFSLQGFLMARRRPEACLRMALGATPGRVMRHFLQGTLLPAWGGIATGLALLLLGRGPMEVVLSGLGSLEPMGLVLLAFGFLGAALGAGILPLIALWNLEPGRGMRAE